MGNKTYVITYKDGQKETFNGNVVFFTDKTSGLLPNSKNLIYLNSDNVRSVIEVKTEGETSDESNK